jgi:tRNA (uracil-5-)-methyltransferase TRM9
MAEESVPGKSEIYENQHVHKVYDQIASHFSATRYKPWPIVEQFLRGLPDGAVGLDVGCGNGKYLPVNQRLFIVASDRSENLVKIAKTHQPHSAIIADTLALPHQDGRFDFAISIAVIHHLSTPTRRIEGARVLLKSLRPAQGYEKHGGKVLIFAWALEQKSSRRGWSEGDEQDVMVPWVMREKRPEGGEISRTFQRYYHLYRKGELEADVQAAGGLVLDSGYEKDNWWVIATPEIQKG